MLSRNAFSRRLPAPVLATVLALAPGGAPAVAADAEPGPAPAVSPSAGPSGGPTPEPMPAPTAVPAPEPTAVPTPEPTPVPTPEPTAVPTPEPTPVPTPGPTPAPIPLPTLSARPVGGGPYDSVISRPKVMARTLTWVAQKVPYSQVRWWTDENGRYRQDCSGYVSMAGRLSERKNYWTGNLAKVSHKIPSASMKPGDILLWPTHHTLIFAGWADEAKTKFNLYEQYKTGFPARYAVGADLQYYLDRGFRAHRYNGILDVSGAPMPAPPTTPEPAPDPAPEQTPEVVQEAPEPAPEPTPEPTPEPAPEPTAEPELLVPPPDVEQVPWTFELAEAVEDEEEPPADPDAELPAEPMPSDSPPDAVVMEQTATPMPWADETVPAIDVSAAAMAGPVPPMLSRATPAPTPAARATLHSRALAAALQPAPDAGAPGSTAGSVLVGVAAVGFLALALPRRVAARLGAWRPPHLRRRGDF